MNEKINLCKILKDCPKGYIFWSSMLGNVEFLRVIEPKIIVNTKEGIWEINSDSTVTIDCFTSAEPMLFPSKDQRDWSKFTAPWLKKEKFDPKTLKVFDRVLVRDDKNYTWHINIYSHKNNHDKNYPYNCIINYFKYCIPYNEETKHLVGTTEEAPEFYRYWED